MGNSCCANESAAVTKSITSRTERHIDATIIADGPTSTRSRIPQKEGRDFSKKAAELQLYIVTWNMKGRLQEPQKNLSLLLDLAGPKHDLYVVGLQEAPKFSGEATLGRLLGELYCCVGLSSMMSLQLYVFARKSLQSNIKGSIVDKVGMGGLSYIVGKQKGAAAVLLGYNNLTLLFITSHLAGMQLVGGL